MPLDPVALCTPALPRALLEHSPSNTHLVLLGGHSFTPPELTPPTGINATRDGIELVFKPVAFAFGFYGFWAPRRNFMPLMTLFRQMVARSLHSRRPLSPDSEYFALAAALKQRVYAVEPLLIGHAASFSHTWHTHRAAILARTIAWQNVTSRPEAGLLAALSRQTHKHSHVPVAARNDGCGRESIRRLLPETNTTHSHSWLPAGGGMPAGLSRFRCRHHMNTDEAMILGSPFNSTLDGCAARCHATVHCRAFMHQKRHLCFLRVARGTLVPSLPTFGDVSCWLRPPVSARQRFRFYLGTNVAHAAEQCTGGRPQILTVNPINASKSAIGTEAPGKMGDHNTTVSRSLQHCCDSRPKARTGDFVWGFVRPTSLADLATIRHERPKSFIRDIRGISYQFFHGYISPLKRSLRSLPGCLQRCEFLLRYGDNYLPAKTPGVVTKARNVNDHNSVLFPMQFARHFGQLGQVESNDRPWEQKTDGVIWRGFPSGTLAGAPLSRDRGAAGGPRFEMIRRWHNTTTVSWASGSWGIKGATVGSAAFVVDVGFSPMPDWKSPMGKSVMEALWRLGLCHAPTARECASSTRVSKGQKSLSEQLKYKLLLSAEGFDVASDLKWKLLSNSVVIMPTPRRVTWFMESLLVPWVHYIPVNDDFSDLAERMMWALAHSDESKLISWQATLWVEQFFATNCEPYPTSLPTIGSNGEPNPKYVGYSEMANRFPAHEEALATEVLDVVLRTVRCIDVPDSMIEEVKTQTCDRSRTSFASPHDLC